MKNYTTIFRQMLNLLPRNKFDSETRKHGYNRYTKHFTVWNQFIANFYAQITGKKSLRDIEAGLRVQYSNWHHLGLRNVSRSQLSYVNNRRGYHIFQHLYYSLFSRCVTMTPHHKFRFKNPLNIMDSTMVNLCLSLFPWAEYQQTKGALKIHTLLDARGTIPSFVVVTPGNESDIKIAKNTKWPLSPDSILVGDRGYMDFEWFNDLDSKGVFFVIRVKDNLKYSYIRQHCVWRKTKSITDSVIKLQGVKTSKKYPKPLRLITIKLDDQKKNDRSIKSITLATNNFNLAASTIGQIYKARWDIEKFFKWIKQNLKIKTFLGTSKNAVLIQIWTALIYYLLLAYIKFQTKYDYSLLHFSRVLNEALFKKSDIIDFLSFSPDKLKKAREPDQQRVLIPLN